jgi:phage gp37-like protein
LNKTGVGLYDSTFNQYVVDAIRSNLTGDHIGGIAGIPSDVDASTMAAARTNPSRPYVDVPASILDIGTCPTRILRDFRDLRRQHGLPDVPGRTSSRENARGMGEAWLTYQFGIKPIVSDIVKMSQFSRVVNDRVAEINRLFGNTGLRRTVKTFDGSRSALISFIAQSAGVYVGYNATATETVEQRVHARWIPSGPSGVKPSAQVIRAWAARSAMGLTVDASTLWEITPWSWLADWFTSIGSYLKASRNIVPATLMGVYPMTHTRTQWDCPGYPITAWWDSNLVLGTLGSARLVKSTKTRRSSFISPFVARLPFLSGDQMGIAASLAATRIR